MRKLAVLLLASSALAQDDGAALFYKGFWLEQAEGKLDEAAALYAQLLKEKPDAPEAPRAVLGLVRIKLARGEDAKDLVAELERRYPKAETEIAAAKRLAGAKANSFSEPVRETDSPVERKMKSLYQMRFNPIVGPDRTFLVDLGAVAHPMLAAMLRDTFPQPVQQATQVLLEQRTEGAYGVLAKALLDDSAVFRSVIVDELRGCPGAPLVLVDALGKLYDGAPPRLRAEVAARLSTMAGREDDGRDRAYAVLARAVDDSDPGVRVRAVALTGAPDAYVDALLERLEAKDPAMGNVCRLLPYLADRAAFRPRVEAIFDGYVIDWNTLPEPRNEDGALLLARRIERELKAGNRNGGVYNLAYMCADWPKAAARLLLVAIELDDQRLAEKVSYGMGERERAQYLGGDAAVVRAAALEAAPGAHGEKERSVVKWVIGMLGLPPEDFPAIVDALRKRGERGIPDAILDWDRLEPLGPLKAGALVEFCRDGKEVAALLAAGRRFAKREDSGLEFFRQVVPKADEAAVNALYDLAREPAVAPIVAERLLAATGPEWAWTTEGRRPEQTRADKQPGPVLWNRMAQAGLLANTPEGRTAIEGRVEDPRLEIAASAVWFARADKTENGTDTLRKALRSKWGEVRGGALWGLAERVPDAPAVVREFAAREDLSEEDLPYVASAVSRAKSPAVTAIAGDLLRKDPKWDGLWPAYSELAPKEAVELALTRIPHTGDSLHVLVACDDPRRIQVFRAVLGGSDRAAIRLVLEAVRDQYLVELGDEALAQLRNPDGSVREAASQAIEKLKFYAEAQKAFQK